MRLDYKKEKGVFLADVNGTFNTLPYKDNKDLWRIVDSCYKVANNITIVDFENKSVYIIMDDKDYEEVRSDLSE